MSIINMTSEEREQFRKASEEKFKARVIAFKSSAKKYYQKFFENIPTRYKRAWLDCFEGKANKSKAIAAKCYECVGYEDTQNNVGSCTSRACPLWHHRPLKPKNERVGG